MKEMVFNIFIRYDVEFPRLNNYQLHYIFISQYERTVGKYSEFKCAKKRF